MPRTKTPLHGHHFLSEVKSFALIWVESTAPVKLASPRRFWERTTDGATWMLGSKQCPKPGEMENNFPLMLLRICLQWKERCFTPKMCSMRQTPWYSPWSLRGTTQKIFPSKLTIFENHKNDVSKGKKFMHDQGRSVPVKKPCGFMRAFSRSQLKVLWQTCPRNGRVSVVSDVAEAHLPQDVLSHQVLMFHRTY